VWNESTQRAFRDLGRLKVTKPLIEEIEGSQYHESTFKEGSIVHLDKKIDIQTKFRYNAFNDEIELVDNTNKVKSIKVAIKDPNIVTFFDDKEFLFLSYTDANESVVSGYLNPIYKGSHINIYQKKGKKFLKGKESVNSLDIAFPPRYSDDIKYFISFSDSPPTYVKLSKKSILKIFNKSKDVKTFINKNRLNLNEISSLIQIAKYVEKKY
tara:strand:- start:29 stop:661 length:633 start_codon:yes stop_codon:yes gene_type:complete